MVPFTWIEHVASPLPRECSTTELKGHSKNLAALLLLQLLRHRIF